MSSELSVPYLVQVAGAGRTSLPGGRAEGSRKQARVRPLCSSSPPTAEMTCVPGLLGRPVSETWRAGVTRVFPVAASVHAGRPEVPEGGGGHLGAPSPWSHGPGCYSVLVLKGVGQSLCEKLLCACEQTAAECMASAFFNQSLKSSGRQECQGPQRPCEDGGQGGLSASSLGSSSEENSAEALPPTAHLRTRRFLGRSLGPMEARPQPGPR